MNTCLLYRLASSFPPDIPGNSVLPDLTVCIEFFIATFFMTCKGSENLAFPRVRFGFLVLFPLLMNLYLGWKDCGMSRGAGGSRERQHCEMRWRKTCDMSTDCL